MASIPRFQRAYGWEEILKIDVTAEKNFRKALLVLYLKGRSPIKLKMRCFESQQLEELFLALEVWGRQSEIGTRLVELQNQLRNDGESSSSSLSYTALWESELSSRFGTTIFTPLEPGACLQEGRLKVIRQLSFGGLSAIYLCQIDGRDLAVLKESVTPEGTRSDIREKALEHFRREAAHLIKLDHPRIIKVMDFFVEDGRTYLLLEYLEGLDLRQYVRQNGPVALDQALLFGIQIARILEYLHTQEPPLIHRDISPDNIVRLSDETLILIDFGAANEFIGTVTGTLVGKQAYISPEQFRGKSVVQSDLYALGGTLYFLLTGEDPEPLSVSRLNSHGLSVCAEMDELIAELTALSVADRVPSAEAARRRLESILRERRTAAEVASSSLAKA
ncbi:MAG TPA: serine/threonine-protein kinase, partial [Chroococcales cyanobacterium]